MLLLADDETNGVGAVFPTVFPAKPRHPFDFGGAKGGEKL
jgi:hypothetical protein